MKMIAFNGSPMGASGNTNVMVTAFLEGAEAAGAEVENIFLADKEINHCKACRRCVFSGGKCVINDDMEELISKYVESDIVVFATPLYIDNISGMLKVFFDRTICIGDPYFEKDENGETRGGKSKHFKNGIPPKMVVISNSGYPERSQFQALSLVMKRVARNFHLDLIAEIYLPAGMVLTAGIKELEPVINGYKETLCKAGREIAADLKLSGETQKSLEISFMPVDIFIQECNKVVDMMLAQAKTSNQS